MDREKEEPTGRLTNKLAVLMRRVWERSEEVDVDNRWREVVKYLGIKASKQIVPNILWC